MQTWQRKTNPLLSTSLSVHLFGYKSSMCYKFYQSFIKVLSIFILPRNFPQFSAVLRGSPRRFWPRPDFDAVHVVAAEGVGHLLQVQRPRDYGMTVENLGCQRMGWLRLETSVDVSNMYQICIKYVSNMYQICIKYVLNMY